MTFRFPRKTFFFSKIFIFSGAYKSLTDQIWRVYICIYLNVICWCLLPLFANICCSDLSNAVVECNLQQFSWFWLQWLGWGYNFYWRRFNYCWRNEFHLGGGWGWNWNVQFCDENGHERLDGAKRLKLCRSRRQMHVRLWMRQRIRVLRGQQDQK